MITIIAAVVGVVFILLVVGVVRMRRGRTHSAQSTGRDGHQVYIGNLSFSVRERQLREAFSPYGQISSLRLIKDRHTGRSRGYAFITFDSDRDAKKSYAMHGKDFHGRDIVVRAAMRKSELET